MIKKHIISLFFLFVVLFVSAQNDGNFKGNLELYSQYYIADSTIKAPSVAEKMLINSWCNLQYTKGKFNIGMRYELYLNALQGYDQRYNGTGIPYRFATYTDNNMLVTVGNFYEQFGSGLILRSYEDKTLGYDNSLDGLLLRFEPLQGLYIKGLIGRHRFFWDKGMGIVRGIDTEANLMDMIEKWNNASKRISLGVSFVSKFQPDDDPMLRLPENVAAVAGRVSFNSPTWTIGAEYVRKANDPSADNNRIYKQGEALLLNMGYAVSGFGFLLTAKRIDNMSFKSDRNAVQNNLYINYLPPITQNHTYLLAAMYPYATQPNNEAGLKAELTYTIPRNTRMGGKFGTTIEANYSRVHNLHKTPNYEGYGYSTTYFPVGKELFFQDISVEIKRKLNNHFKLITAYYNIMYNKDVLQGITGLGIIKSHVAVADIEWKIQSKHTIRTELQHLFTRQDEKNWAMALVEYTFAPHWFVSLRNQYSYTQNIHYVYAACGYTQHTTRLQLGYGKQREGIICVGGICRNVPASNGISVSLSISF